MVEGFRIGNPTFGAPGPILAFSLNRPPRPLVRRPVSHSMPHRKAGIELPLESQGDQALRRSPRDCLARLFDVTDDW
jgi:hypothetical protein